MQTNKSINTRSFTLFVCCDCGGGLSQDEVTILYIYIYIYVNVKEDAKIFWWNFGVPKYWRPTM